METAETSPAPWITIRYEDVRITAAVPIALALERMQAMKRKKPGRGEDRPGEAEKHEQRNLFE